MQPSFNAARIPEYNVLVDRLPQGIAKVAIRAVLTGLGLLGRVATQPETDVLSA